MRKEKQVLGSAAIGQDSTFHHQLTRSRNGDKAHSTTVGRRADYVETLELRCRRMCPTCVCQAILLHWLPHTPLETQRSLLYEIVHCEDNFFISIWFSPPMAEGNPMQKEQQRLEMSKISPAGGIPSDAINRTVLSLKRRKPVGLGSVKSPIQRHS